MIRPPLHPIEAPAPNPEMAKEADGAFYERRAKQELEAAGATADPAIKAVHLDLASRYATLREVAERDGAATGLPKVSA